ncbi:MAG: sulfite exporter TauE/SafE family protein [Elusimicrobia bacterium]|nr:sulfite exporter TauE/SafE family protein [Elusimicrobiota bacterium]
MEYFIICAAALIASGLTLFSGFGLGTVLMPVFSIFFPLDISVAMTAIVHFLNNLFKLTLLGRNADKKVVLLFGGPAMLAAALGAALLLRLAGGAPLFVYELAGRQFQVMPVKAVIAALILVFSAGETLPAVEKLSFDKKYLPLGGILSGFVGGLSGLQGALRSAFLIKSGLPKEVFIATGAVIAALVDVTRITVYIPHFKASVLGGHWPLVVLAVASAFLGAFLGSRLVKKVTMRAVQLTVAVMLCAVALGLGLGLI